jgi:hypothetical protein
MFGIKPWKAQLKHQQHFHDELLLNGSAEAMCFLFVTRHLSTTLAPVQSMLTAISITSLKCKG